jgi:hypothetical protein
MEKAIRVKAHANIPPDVFIEKPPMSDVKETKYTVTYNKFASLNNLT